MQFDGDNSETSCLPRKCELAPECMYVGYHVLTKLLIFQKAEIEFSMILDKIVEGGEQVAAGK